MNIFTPGNIMFLQRDGEKAKHQCRLLGTRAQQYLVVEILPSAKGLPVYIMGDRCVVRLLHDGKIYGFRTVIERTLSEPFALGLLHYPAEFESKNLREGSRVQSNLPVRLERLERPKDESSEEEEAPSTEATDDEAAEPPKPSQPHVATIIDISESGLQIAVPVLSPEEPEGEEADDAPDIGDGAREDYVQENLAKTYIAGDIAQIQFTLPAPVEAEFENVRVKVCWAKFNGLHLFTGLCFLEPPDDLTAGIRTLIEHQNTYFQSEIVSPMPR